MKLKAYMHIIASFMNVNRGLEKFPLSNMSLVKQTELNLEGNCMHVLYTCKKILEKTI